MQLWEMKSQEKKREFHNKIMEMLQSPIKQEKLDRIFDVEMQYFENQVVPANMNVFFNKKYISILWVPYLEDTKQLISGMVDDSEGRAISVNFNVIKDRKKMERYVFYEYAYYLISHRYLAYLLYGKDDEVEDAKIFLTEEELEQLSFNRMDGYLHSTGLAHELNASAVYLSNLFLKAKKIDNIIPFPNMKEEEKKKIKEL